MSPYPALPRPQEAWRAAASERARRGMQEREAALRRELAAECDEQLRAVVARLEEDALAREAEAQAGGAAGALPGMGCSLLSL